MKKSSIESYEVSDGISELPDNPSFDDVISYFINQDYSHTLKISLKLNIMKWKILKMAITSERLPFLNTNLATVQHYAELIATLLFLVKMILSDLWVKFKEGNTMRESR
jgi:hypothetical protein